MTSYIIILLFLCINPVLAAHAGEAPPAKALSKVKPVKTLVEKTGPSALTVEEFIQWLLDTGKDRIDFDNRNAKPLNLPSGGVRNKARGAPSKQNADKTYRASHLVIKKSRFRKKIKPECLILITTKNYYKRRKAKDWAFRFSLDGSLERVFSSLGKADEQGKRVRASNVITVQDIEDPEIQERAQSELDFWLKRAARLIAKKKAASKKRTSSPVPAEKPVPHKP